MRGPELDVVEVGFRGIRAGAPSETEGRSVRSKQAGGAVADLLRPCRYLDAGVGLPARQSTQFPRLVWCCNRGLDGRAVASATARERSSAGDAMGYILRSLDAWPVDRCAGRCVAAALGAAKLDPSECSHSRGRRRPTVGIDAMAEVALPPGALPPESRRHCASSPRFRHNSVNS